MICLYNDNIQETRNEIIDKVVYVKCDESHIKDLLKKQQYWIINCKRWIISWFEWQRLIFGWLDLSNMDFSNMELKWMYFWAFNFVSKILLRWIQLWYVYWFDILEKWISNFYELEIDLSKIDVEKIIRISWADLSWTNLCWSDLYWANFGWTVLSWTNLSSTNLSRALISWKISEWKKLNLANASLRWGQICLDFRKVIFDWIKFDEIDLSYCTFDGLDLRWYDFIDCNLDSVTFEWTNLQWVKFDGSKFAYTNFKNADMSWADLSDAWFRWSYAWEKWEYYPDSANFERINFEWAKVEWMKITKEAKWKIKWYIWEPKWVNTRTYWKYIRWFSICTKKRPYVNFGIAGDIEKLEEEAEKLREESEKKVTRKEKMKEKILGKIVEWIFCRKSMKKVY